MKNMVCNTRGMSSSDALLLTSDTGHYVQMTSSHGKFLHHEHAYDVWYPPMSLWHTTTSHFHKKHIHTTWWQGNDERAAVFLSVSWSDLSQLTGAAVTRCTHRAPDRPQTRNLKLRLKNLHAAWLATSLDSPPAALWNMVVYNKDS